MTLFKIYKDKSGQFRFFFKLKDNVALISEPYSSMYLCLQKLHFFKRNASNDSYYIRQTASCGSPFFTFQKGFNGERLGTSESFVTIKAMEDSIVLMRSSAKSTIIDDSVYAV